MFVITDSKRVLKNFVKEENNLSVAHNSDAYRFVWGFEVGVCLC